MTRFLVALRVILIGYVLIAITYSLVTPILDASDELWHFAFVKAIADTGALPVQNPAAPGDYRQEGGQPPLYYAIGAALTLWIDTRDFHTVRQINPHADLGLISPDGNSNIIVHDPAREAFPWRGTTLAVHLLRLYSIALGAVTVIATYRLARALFPSDSRLIPIGAAALVAFNPMFLFVSSTVNNDNLSNALASVLLVQLVQLVRRPDPPRLRTLIAIGVVAGMGLLAKFNLGFLLILVALALAWNAWQRKSIRPLVVGGAITGGLTILIAGWWYVRNIQLYGDPTGLNVFLKIVGSRAIAADARELWSERHTFLMSFWGFFGAVNIPLPDVAYTVFNAIAAIGVSGALLWLIDGLTARRRAQSIRARQSTRTTQSVHRISAQRIMPIRPADRTALTIARTFSLIWIGMLFASLIGWTTVTWASQGRLLFAALAPIMVWIAVGLRRIGDLIRPLFRPARGGLIALAMGCFAMMAVYSPLVIASHYAPPQPDPMRDSVSSGTNKATFCEPSTIPGERPCFAVALVEPSNSLTATPGGYLHFTLWIQPQGLSATQPFTHTWSLFAHLVDSHSGRIIAQRDVYPGGGLIDTQRIVPNAAAWDNPIALKLSDYTDVSDLSAPPELRIGLYDYATGQRMILMGSNPADQNEWHAGKVTLAPNTSTLLTVPAMPNPINVSFGDRMTLIGYKVSSLAVEPGGSLTVTLYWYCPHKLDVDYHVFIHLIDPQSTTIFGQNDAMPANWARPTTTWKPGEVIEDAHTFPIHLDAKRESWPIEIGVYQLGTAGQITRLRAILPDGSDPDNYVDLTPIRIVPPIGEERF